MTSKSMYVIQIEGFQKSWGSQKERYRRRGRVYVGERVCGWEVACRDNASTPPKFRPSQRRSPKKREKGKEMYIGIGARGEETDPAKRIFLAVGLLYNQWLRHPTDDWARFYRTGGKGDS